MDKFDQKVYEVSQEILLKAGTPEPLADAVSRIVASDDPTLPYSGRDPIDNEMVQQVLPYLNKESE